MNLTYREMQIGDLPAATAVRISTVENAITVEELESDYGITPQSMAEAMTSHVKGWLCESSGNVVGFAMGDRSNGEVLVVAVLPEYEGRGIGKSVLAQVQTWLFTEGHEEIWLYSNPDPSIRAYGFYRNLGWRSTGMLPDDDEVLKLRKHTA
jgi:ribosomal protein S18 acetylase RimI-like enzyme